MQSRTLTVHESDLHSASSTLHLMLKGCIRAVRLQTAMRPIQSVGHGESQEVIDCSRQKKCQEDLEQKAPSVHLPSLPPPLNHLKEPKMGQAIETLKAESEHWSAEGEEGTNRSSESYSCS